MEFCHIAPWNSEAPYCGATGVEAICNTPYDGEAICPDCGNPTCPRCALLESLDAALAPDLTDE